MNWKFIILLFWVFITVFIVSACGARQAAPVSTPIPDWYLQPAKYLAPNLLYGSGEGANRVTAKQRALQNMTYNLQLQVQTSSVGSISSNRDTNNQVTTSASFQENIALRAKKIRFTAVKEHKLEKLGTQFYAVLTTSYDDLIADNRNKLEKNIPLLSDALQKLGTASPLEKIAIFSQSTPLYLTGIDSLENLETIRIAYKQALIRAAYLKEKNNFFRKYQQTQDQAKSGIVLQIKGQKQWSATKNLLANHLQAQGYKVGPNPNVILEISGTQEEHLLFDGKVKQVKIVVLISLQETNNTILASKEFDFKATSLQTHEAASRKAQTKLKKNLKTDIFQLLGL